MSTADPTARVRFDHRSRGTSANEWAEAIEGLPSGAAIGPHDHVLVVAAHPDDETLGAGGLIADAAVAGAEVTVVVATLGERSHPESRTHGAADLARLRSKEIAAAVRTLAPRANLLILARPDGGLADDPAGLLRELLQAAGDATVIVAPWRADGHPDHEACGAAAAAVADAGTARLLEYPIWGWHWGDPGRTGPTYGSQWVRRTMSEAAVATKRAAVETHRSQHTPLSPEPGDAAVLSPGFLRHFDGPYESFVQAPPRDLAPSYFDRLYQRSDDPWQMRNSFYEQRKRRLLLASLPRRTYRSCLEPGSAAGLLTVELAARCSSVLALDVSAAAVEATRSATAHLDHVESRRATIPGGWPEGEFDLVVISEIGYYLADPAHLDTKARASLTADGTLVACHWRRPAPGYPSTAEDVHAALGNGLYHLVEHVEDDFLLDVWTVPSLSVAALNGVV